MTAKSKLITSPPYPVERSLKRLGNDLRTARLRRNMTLEEVAEKIGTTAKTVQDAEKGKPSTGVAVYVALLWALDLLHQLDDIALPEKDEEGQRLALAREKKRARAKTGLNNDF